MGGATPEGTGSQEGPGWSGGGHGRGQTRGNGVTGGAGLEWRGSREGPATPRSLPSRERNVRSWTHASMRSLWPCSDSSRTPSFPSQLQLKIGLPRANPRET